VVQRTVRGKTDPMSCCMHEAIVAILVEGVPAPLAADEAIVLESVPGSPGIVLAADEAISPAVREGMVVDEGASPAARGSALGEMPGGPKKAKRNIKGVKRSLQTVLGDEPVFAEPPALLLSPRAVAVAEGKGAGKTQAQVHQHVFDVRAAGPRPRRGGPRAALCALA
jgi:hypothetical protein